MDAVGNIFIFGFRCNKCNLPAQYTRKVSNMIKHKRPITVIASLLMGLVLAACASSAAHKNVPVKHPVVNTTQYCPKGKTCNLPPDAQAWASSSNTPNGALLGQAYIEAGTSGTFPQNAKVLLHTMATNVSGTPYATEPAWSITLSPANQTLFQQGAYVALQALWAAWQPEPSSAVPGAANIYPILAGHWPSESSLVAWAIKYMDPNSPRYEDVSSNFSGVPYNAGMSITTDLAVQTLEKYTSGQQDGDFGFDPAQVSVYTTGVMESMPTVHHNTFVELVNGKLAKIWIPYKVAFARTGIDGTAIQEVWQYMSLINNGASWEVWRPAVYSQSTFPGAGVYDGWKCASSADVSSWNATDALATAMSQKPLSVPSGCVTGKGYLPFG